MSDSAQLDHLVVAASSLDQAVRWCEATFGVAPGPGGRHAFMGTHNRLLRIDGDHHPRAYLELIAIDPDAPAPQRPRWFGLDTVDLTRGPRLLHWVARVADLSASLQRLRALGIDAGSAIAAERETPQGLLRWRIALRDDGRLLADGALPTLIEWGDRHPCDTLPASAVSLRALRVAGLDAAVVDALGLSGVDQRRDAPPLEADFQAPAGQCTLRA